MKSSNELRKLFFDFFISKKHTFVESAPVVPQNDPTILFTNAGMNQFKDVFMSTGKRDYTRAVDTQKCIRVSGKHNDLEEVGVDTYHHTFFEMLGNWSFGDYFKEEAIEWAWEFLTKEIGIDPAIMYATVFGGDESMSLPADEEAAEIWLRKSSLPKERILYCGAKDNFWEMGETGPCGPCSEIHVDRGVDACDMKGIEGHECKVNGDCSRYIEIWNLVFMQYNRLSKTKLEPLPDKHVDTGMGFERLLALVNGKLSNYDTDLFAPMFSKLAKMSSRKYGENEETDIAFRVIADHARALSMAISDGINPGNTGRGYVLRRLLRRAVRYGRQVLGIETPFLYSVASETAKIYQDIFPQIKARLPLIKEILISEEKTFSRTIDNGIKKFEELAETIKRSNDNKLDGKDAFVLYSTFGFPRDLIELMAREKGFELDVQGWESAQKLHESASQGAKKSLVNFDINELRGLSPTTFLGYPENGEYLFEKVVSPLKVIDNRILVVNETVFYAESGGQVGDTGHVFSIDGETELFTIKNTKKTGDYILHEGNFTGDITELPEKVLMKVDKKRRMNIMANHTATHLLHWALGKVLGPHATQHGSSVEAEKLRFDFAHNSKLSKEQIIEIETLVNSKILESSKVETKVLTLKEARETGAKAIFGEKYGDTVRVISIGDYSSELCGGTHIPDISQIGNFYITEESSLSIGVRRIVAVTREAAWKLSMKTRNELKGVSELLNVPTDQVGPRISKLLATIKELKTTEAKKGKQDIKLHAEKLVANAKKINDVLIVTAHFPEFNRSQASELADLVKSFNKKCAGFIVAGDGKGGLSLIVFSSKELKSVHAGNILKELSPIVDGRGGGRPDFAQGGGKNSDAVPLLLEKAYDKFASLVK